MGKGVTRFLILSKVSTKFREFCAFSGSKKVHQHEILIQFSSAETIRII